MTTSDKSPIFVVGADEKVGTVMFPEGNQIVFGQDMGWFIGMPPGVEFTIQRVTDNGMMWLKAPGYGESGAYGNGAIVLYLDTRPKADVRSEVIAEAVRRLSNPELAEQLAKAAT